MKLDTDTFQVGDSVFIWGLNKFFTGVLMKINDDSVVLKSAGWIAETGRLSQFLAKPSEPKDVEMYPHPIQVNLDAVVDITKVAAIPTKTTQK